MEKYDVIGLGNALLDIIVEVNESDLENLKLNKGGFTLLDESRVQVIMEFISSLNSVRASGGSSANVTIGVSKLGGNSCFIGKVGKDEEGDLYEDFLIGDKVNPILTRSNKETGTAITFITPDLERTFAVYLGAAIDITEEDIQEEEIKKAKILHIESYQLEDESLRKAAIHAMNIAKENNILISLDLSDPFLVERNKDFLNKIVTEYIDILFANETEAKAYTGLEEEFALNKISEQCKIAIVKLGIKGSLIKHNNEIYKIPINKVKEVNTNGAGDAYAAGILFAISYNLPLEKAGLLAAFISSKVVERTEATISKQIQSDVERITGFRFE